MQSLILLFDLGIGPRKQPKGTFYFIVAKERLLFWDAKVPGLRVVGRMMWLIPWRHLFVSGEMCIVVQSMAEVVGSEAMDDTWSIRRIRW
jgi:hypothetical protein